MSKHPGVNFKSFRELDDAEVAAEELAHDEPPEYATVIEAGSDDNPERGLLRMFFGLDAEAVESMAREWGETHDWSEVKYEVGPQEPDVPAEPKPEPVELAPYAIVVKHLPARDWVAEMASVTVTVDGRCYEVEVYGPDYAYGSPELRPAKLNWSAYGSVPAEHGTAYAMALAAAAALAPTLAGPIVPAEDRS